MNGIVDTLTQSEAANKARILIEEGKAADVIGFMKLGAGLCLASDFKVYKSMGMTFEQYIAEAKLKHGKAYQAIGVWKKFGHLNFQGVFHSRLIILNNKRLQWDDIQKQEAIDKARDLGPRDFERFVAEKKGKTMPEACPHDSVVTICEKCRARIA